MDNCFKRFLSLVMAVLMVVSYVPAEAFATEIVEVDSTVHEHTYEESIIAEATCTEAGAVSYTCSCEDSYTEEIPANGHDFVDGACTVCGEADPNYIPPTEETEAPEVEETEAPEVEETEAPEVEETEAPEVEETEAATEATEAPVVEETEAAEVPEVETGVELNFNGTEHDEAAVENPVAKVGDVDYGSLDEAINEANPGDTIVITAKLTDVDVTVSKNVTIDLGGNTLNDAYIKVAATVTIQNGSIKNTQESYPLVVNSGKLTVENVAIEASKSDRAIWVRGGELVFNSGSILVTKGENNTTSGNITAIYTSSNTNVTINGGSITVDTPSNKAVAIFGNYANANVTVNDGKISTNGGNYSYGIHVDGDITINGGEIVTNEKQYGYSSGITYGYNYALNSALGDITITGGKITTNGHSGYIANVGRTYSAADQTITITGGEFVNVLTETDKTTGGHKVPALIKEGTAATVSVSVKNGKFSGFSGTELVKGSKTTTTVSGGTFDVAVDSKYLADGLVMEDNGNGTFGVAKAPVAKIGDTGYASLADASAAAQSGDEIKLLADVTEDVTLPAGVIFNGNGKQVGTITAAGEVTFKGHTKATNFSVQNTNTTINIGEGACLEITGTGRLVIGHGCTFNITGTITDAKTANTADLTPSLIMPGASFTGAGVNFIVKNAYIKAPSSYCSSSKSASGTFVFDIENSIWENGGKLAFEAQSTAATVNFNLKDSVLTTGSHLVFGVSRGEVIIDNSNVNVGTSRQIENRSTMTIKNGSVVNGAVATSSNAINPGTLIVENATYAVTGEFSGSGEGTGTLIVKKGATVSAGSITKANIQIDATDMNAGDEINLTADLSKLTGNMEVINNDDLVAKIEDGKVVLAERTLSGTGTQEDPFLIKDLVDLKLFANKVNAGDTFSGKYVTLTADIDLKNEEWTPIATFNGYFDGGNHTISNLVVNGGSNSNQGFFGQTNNGEIKNVIFKNAKVTGRLNVGVVAGTPYTSKYTNIMVTGHVEVNGMAYVGGVGGKNAYADWTDIIVNVDDSSYVKATSTEDGVAYRSYVGGVVGFNGEGGHTFKNISSNIKVIGDVCDIGGLFGIAHYGNNFENVTFTGSVEAPEGAEEVGGIAGVWHNQAGTKVTMTDVTSTGTVTVGGEDVSAKCGVVGGAYNAGNDTADSSGSLVIDGAPVWPVVAKIGDQVFGTLKAAAEAAQDGDEIILLDNATVDGTLALPAGITLTSNGHTITGSIRMLGNLHLNGPLTITGGLWVGKAGETMTATLSGDKLTAAYFMFQRGTYTIDADIDAVYGYLSFEGTFEVNSTIHTTGTNGEVLYINGNVTLNDGAVLDSDNSVFVCNEAAVLTLNPGSKVDSKVNLTKSGAKLISSGDITGEITAVNGASISISAGTYAMDVTAWCAEGYVCVDKENGTYGVKAAQEAWILRNNVPKFYATLAAAIADAQPGETVMLCANAVVDERITINKDLTISDYGSLTVTFTGDSGITIVNDAEVTLDNFNINISNVNAGGDAIFCIGDYSNNAKLNLVDMNVSGDGYSAAYAVFYVYNTSELNINGGKYDLSNDKSDEGGFIKAQSGKNGIVNITDSDIFLTDAMIGFLDGTVKLDGVELNIKGGANAINQSALTVIDSTITVDGADGRALTLSQGDVTIQNSTLNFSNCSEGEIRFKKALTLNVDEDSTIAECDIYADVSSGAKVNDTEVTGTEANPATIVNATVTNPEWVAMVGTTYYMTLAEAVAAGSEVNLLRSFELDETVKVNGTVVLNLNGKTITGTDNATGNFALIEIQPGADLTIKGEGKITLTATTDRDWNAYSSVISNQRGKLTVEAGTIEHLGGTDMAYGIDNLTNGKSTYAETIINGGIIKSTYRGIRQFLNGVEAQNILTVNGGTIEGANKSIWMQDPSKNANTGKLTVGENATLKGDVYLYVTEGSTEWPVEVSIAAAALADDTEVITGNVPAGYELVKENGTYGVKSGAAKIGNTYYATLAEAFAAIGGGDVVIELLNDVAMDYGARSAFGTDATTSVTINGNGYTMTLNQTDSDWSSMGLKNADAKLVLNNMTVEKTGYGDTSGAWNTHAIIFSCNVEMTDVTVNNSMAVQNGATLNKVTINEANGYYGLWINGNGQTVTVNGGAINATNGGRGIKIADEYVDAPASVTLSVTGTEFNTAKKAAVLVSSTAGAAITASNVDITNVAEDSVNFVWVDEDWSTDYSKVTVTGGTVAQESIDSFTTAIVEDGKVVGYYKTLQAAVNAVKAGDNTIKLLTDISEDVIIKQVEGVNVVIDGNDKVYSGTFTIHGNARYTGEETLTFQNFKFETAEASHYFIDSNSTGSVERYAHNVTVKDSTFTATDAAVNSAVAMRIRQGFDIAIENVTATDMHSLLQAYGNAGITVNNVNINGKNGISAGTSTNVVITNAEITATGYGIRADGSVATTMMVTDSKIDANQPIVVRENSNAAYNVTLENIDLTAPDGEYDVIFTTGKDDAEYVAPSHAANVSGAENLNVYPVHTAKIGDTYYTTLANAIAAVKDGDTVTLLAGTFEEGTIKLPATLKNVTFEGEEGAILKDMTIMAYDGNSISYEGLTFDGITFENSRISITGWRTGGATVKDFTVTNCTFENLNDTTNSAPVHINMAATEAVENFTFTNNVIDGATGGSKSGVYAQVTGKTIFTGNTINNVSFRPYVIQLTTDDGIADEFIVSDNTFSGSAAGRAQGLGNNAAGTDTVKLVVSENIFKDITNAQQICYWNFNPETTIADLSKNYYDIDIQANPNKFYFNSSATDVADLVVMGVYPYYAKLNQDGTIDKESLVEAPKLVAQIGTKMYTELSTALAAVTDDTTLKIFEGTYDAALVINKSNVTVIGEGNVTLNGVPSIKGTNYKVENIDFVYGTGSTNLSGSGLIKDCSFTATNADGNTFRYCYGTKDAAITFENCVLTAPMWAIHFDSAPGMDLTLVDCEINGRVALGGDLGSLTATGTTFEKGYVNVWGVEDEANFTECEFVDVPYIFTGYDADNTFNFDECTTTVGGESKSVADIIWGGNDAANAEIYVDGVLKSGAAKIGDVYYLTLADAFAAAQPGDEVKILKAGTYALSTSGKDITITGAVDGVVFDNIGAKNMGGANVTFNNVTFDYYPNVNYTGLQHSGNLVYNNCTFDGQVFLYGASETFNNCTFNQNSADAYNVWTYGAKEVAFNECTFNSVGKSVLIYNEGAAMFNDVTVTDCDFIASAPVDGKAAIEMDSSLTAGINLTIDAATTATGFGTGNVSGNSLWNNKMDNKTEANNDITVDVNGVTVLEPLDLVAETGDVKYTSLQDAIDAAADRATVTVVGDVSGAGAVINKNVTIDFGGNTYTFNEGVGSTGTLSNGLQILKGNTVILKNGTLKVADEAADTFYTVIQNYANLTVTDMTLDGTNLDKWAFTDGDSYVLSNNSGIVNITGETNIIANNDGEKAFAFDVCKYADYDAPTVNIRTTGKIEGAIEVSEEISTNLNIYGGTYTVPVDPDWCADGYGPIANADGTYGVAPVENIVASLNGFNYSSIAEAVKAAEADAVITVLAGHAVTETIFVDKSVTIDLDGNELTANGIYPVIRVIKEAEVTITGNGSITNSDYVFVVGEAGGTSSGKLIIENGTFHGATTVASVTKGELTINGGYFSVDPYTGDGYANYNFLLNCIDKNYKDGSAKIIVNGGSFENYNPEDNAAETVGTSFVADGFEATTSNGSVWNVVPYGVVAENATTGKQFKTVSAALAAANSGDTVTLLNDAEESYVVIAPGVTLDLQGYTLTADRLVGFNGSYLGATPNSGKLIVPQGNLILSEQAYKNEKNQDVLPIWDPVNEYYLFSLFVANTNHENYGLWIDEEQEKIEFRFIHQATGAINKGLLKDGADDNELAVVIRLEWTDEEQGLAHIEFKYNNDQVRKVAVENQRYYFGLGSYGKLGIDINTLKVQARVVTNSGATAFGTPLALENAK